MSFASVWAASTLGKEVRQSPTIFGCLHVLLQSSIAMSTEKGSKDFQTSICPTCLEKSGNMSYKRAQQKCQQQHTECQDTMAKGPMEDSLQ